MGGSGGSYFQQEPEDIKKSLQDSINETDDAEYKTRINNLLASHLTEFNDRNTRRVSEYLDEILKSIKVDGSVKLLFGGSVAKNTYVNGLSDVDSLVILDNCELAEKTPGEAKDYFAECLRDAFPDNQITEGELAVTVSFHDIEIQLLPAISCENHLKIADAKGENWSLIRPAKFAEVLTKTNDANSRKVVPTIKLAKGIIAALPEKQQITGYHAESLAIEVFKDYKGDHNLKAMVKHFFDAGSQLVRHPIKDRSGQSVHVDEYLGDSNSVERSIVSDAFSRLSRKMTNADSARSEAEWENLFQ